MKKPKPWPNAADAADFCSPHPYNPLSDCNALGLTTAYSWTLTELLSQC